MYSKELFLYKLHTFKTATKKAVKIDLNVVMLTR